VFNSTQRTRSTTLRLAFSVVASGLLVLGSVATVAAAQPSTSTAGASTLVPLGDGATRIWPSPKIVDLQRQAWDHITVGAGGKRLVVYFWMGPEACNGLGKVDVSRHDGSLQIQLWTGIRPHKMGFVCPEYAQLYKTVVHLDRPIIGGSF